MEAVSSSSIEEPTVGSAVCASSCRRLCQGVPGRGRGAGARSDSAETSVRGSIIYRTLELLYRVYDSLQVCTVNCDLHEI